ncbi:MAG: CDP-alcohol phosphatidyltransferase family protein [Balneola sp.]|nr:CDP-alcohol phosphatidyltransferase family protein [Balneola sp.]
MISIYKIKPKFQQLLKPVLVLLNKYSITANQITISAIFLSLLIGLSFWFSSNFQLLFLIVPIGLLIRMALNALDGMMARTYDQQSKLGEVLNEVGDVISDLFIYFPLLKIFSQDLYLVALFLVLTVLNEFSGLIGKIISQERRYDGPMGKSDRAFVISIVAILLFFDINIFEYSTWVFIVLNSLIAISTYKRLSNSLHNV